MAGSLKRRAGAVLSLPPPPFPSRPRLRLAVLVEDPGLDGLHGFGGPLHGPEVVEVPALRTRAERPRRERHVDLALGAPPQGEAHELGPRERTVLEDHFGLADEALGTVF